MAKEDGSHRYDNTWHHEFEQVEQEWIDWYRANGFHYETIEDAWCAFEPNLRGKPNTFNFFTLPGDQK